MTDDIEEMGGRSPLRAAPRIGCFNGEEPQYFLYVENRPIFLVTNISRAIVLWFILHYIFNLEYCSHVKSVAMFYAISTSRKIKLVDNFGTMHKRSREAGGVVRFHQPIKKRILMTFFEQS